MKIFKKKAQKCQIFSIRNYPKIPKNAYIGCKSPKFFRGRALDPPLIGRLRLLFCRLAKIPAENPGVLYSCETDSDGNLLAVCFATLEALLLVDAAQWSAVLPGGTPSL